MERIFKNTGAGTDHMVMVLVPNFSMNAFTSMIEAMRLANYVAQKALYSWETVSRDGEPVMASNGLFVGVSRSVTQFERTPDTITLCAGIDAHIYKDNAVIGWLRRWAREGSHIGAICTGAHVLAHAGLLQGYRCTVHWENLDSMAEEFPELDLRAELFEIDRQRFTCAGGTATTDMMLQDIAVHHGTEIAAEAARMFMHERIREGTDSQKLPLQVRLRVAHPRLIKAISEMEKHTEEALERDEIASRVGLSRRQLERLFRRYLNTSPARYYLKLRLNRAKTLLTQTSMPVTEVAFACGFTSASHFSKCYRDMFAKTPRHARGLSNQPS
ncbi:MAG: GlxA family transcriptional regulator, partial [Alphaproteobacteria bacterium]